MRDNKTKIRTLSMVAAAFYLLTANLKADEPRRVDANGNVVRETNMNAALAQSGPGGSGPFAAGESIAFSSAEAHSVGQTRGAVETHAAPAAEETEEAAKLAKQLSNPISSLISVPFQANEDLGYGPTGDGYKFTLNIQPVIPLSISKDWNLILRTIFPIVSQHDLFYDPNLPRTPGFAQNRSQDGLSDTNQSFFFSPKKPGPFGLVWGVGPVFLYPTGTHPLLGTGTFSVGPTAVVLKQVGGWTVGALANQLWSVVEEEHRSSFSQLFLQPFAAYTTKTHTTFTLSSEMSANWNADSGERLTIPVIFQISQILKIGKQPISIQVGGKYYADSPRYGPSWGARLAVTLLYPTARPPAKTEAAGYTK